MSRRALSFRPGVPGRYCRLAGFTPTDVKPWVQSGIQSPDTIMSWHREGFTPQETAKWQAKGFTLLRAMELRKQGLTVQ